MIQLVRSCPVVAAGTRSAGGGIRQEIADVVFRAAVVRRVMNRTTGRDAAKGVHHSAAYCSCSNNSLCKVEALDIQLTQRTAIIKDIRIVSNSLRVEVVGQVYGREFLTR